MAEIRFNPMDDDRYYNQGPILLIVSGIVHEACFESSRNWFYLHNHWQPEGIGIAELPDYINEDDDRLEGWAFCEIWRNHD